MGRIYAAETTERLLIDDMSEKWTINLPPDTVTSYVSLACWFSLIAAPGQERQ